MNEAAASRPLPAARGDLDALAALLDYPHDGLDAALSSCRAALARSCPPAATSVGELADALAGRSRAEREELFVGTFDMSSACALEVGWHLFGEEYERGAFLVRLRGLARRHGIAEEGELPDHLGVVLRLLDRLPQPEARALAGEYVLPAVAKIRAALPADNPYALLLRAIQASLGGELHAAADGRSGCAERRPAPAHPCETGRGRRLPLTAGEAP